ncbi:hypothetical protein JCM19238_161 [Vibrio ponticus]|nr:hypothetical protein JCM19238_161 [Vibrio ponticus]
MTSTNNDSLLPLQDMALPAAPDWLPLAWGWWASFAAGAMTLILIAVYFRWKKKRLAAKKTA